MTREEAIADIRDNIKPVVGGKSLDMAIEALEVRQSEDAINRYSVPHKIAEFFSNWDGDEDAKMEISVNDMREIASTYQGKVRIEQQFKAMMSRMRGEE